MLLSQFLSSVLHTFLPPPIRVSAVVPNLIPRSNSRSMAMWSRWSLKRGSSGSI
jgi:hypothetical protein